MNLNLEISKELYMEEVKKLKNLPFYRYLQKERSGDIKREVYLSITSKSDADVFKDVEISLKGQILEGIREESGDSIGGDVREKIDTIRKSERDKNNEQAQKEHENIKDRGYWHAIDYLCCVLVIKKLEEKLSTLGVIPEIDVEGKITFKTNIK